jgi:hypothetical protein
MGVKYRIHLWLGHNANLTFVYSVPHFHGEDFGDQVLAVTITSVLEVIQVFNLYHTGVRDYTLVLYDRQLDSNYRVNGLAVQYCDIQPAGQHISCSTWPIKVDSSWYSHGNTIGYKSVTYYSLEWFWLGRMRFWLEQFMYGQRFLTQLPDFNEAAIVTIRSHNQWICIFSDYELELWNMAICEWRSKTAVSTGKNGNYMKYSHHCTHSTKLWDVIKHNCVSII